MRGEGFNVHYTDGQKVHAGDLLVEFDRDLIRHNGYRDTVVTFMVRPKLVDVVNHVQFGTTVHHGERVIAVTANK